MQTFIVGIVVGVIKKLLEDEATRERLVGIVKALIGGVIAERILPVIPTAVASAVDTAIQQIPGIENVKDVAEVAQAAAENVAVVADRLVPDIDTGVPWLDKIMDSWRPRPS